MFFSSSRPRIYSMLALATRWHSVIATPLASELQIREQFAFPYNPGFPIQKVIATALNVSTHSWEFGTATEALLELYDPDLSIFGEAPFTAAQRVVNASTLPVGLAYAAEKIVFGTGPNALSDGDGAVGDPASLGVGAYLLGTKSGYQQFGAAATETMGYVVGSAPRAWNGAISHRVLYVETWADFVYMAPPFLAYYAAATANLTLLHEAVYQCQAYRQIHHYNTTSPNAPFTGLWEHIIGPVNYDPGLWSTGNAWAAAGITRVLATVIKAPTFPSNNATEADEISQWRSTATTNLTALVQETVDAVIGSGIGSYDGGLVRNYFNDPTIFGETSGSALFAATLYRLIVLCPKVFGRAASGSKYIEWAEGIRQTLGGAFVDSSGTTLEHVDRGNGTVRPAVNPLDWDDVNPWMTGSPEGQSMVTMLYAAWRDCLQAHEC